VRACGETKGGGGFGAHDHICWPFDGLADLMPAVVEWLGEGLAMDLRVEFVADRPVTELRGVLGPLGDLDELTASGALRVTSLEALYGGTVAFDAERQVDAYAAATRAALADGFLGYRVAADGTGLVRTEAGRRAFARYEHLVDHLMVTEPFSALCAYDRSVLGADVQQLACLHPVARAGATPFAFFAGEDGLALRGEMDAFDTALLRTALERTLPLSEGEQVTLDASDVRFADHHALLALEQHGRASNATITLKDAASTVTRLGGLLELHAVRIAGRT
jgi:hypothetical protein